MGYAVMRYSVKDGRLEENRALIAGVFEELDQTVPQALQYLALELEDGEFIHVIGSPDESGPSPLLGLSAFKAFTEHHIERRSTPVMRSQAKVMGNYRMLAGPKPTT